MAFACLIVDDNHSLRDDLKNCVIKAIPESVVFEATNKNEALNFVRQFIFSIIISDLQLDESDEDGFDILKAAKYQSSATQVIILTSYPRPEHIKIVQELEAFDYINRIDRVINYQELLIMKIREALKYYKYIKQEQKDLAITFTLPPKGRHPRMRFMQGSPFASKKSFEMDADLLKEISATVGTLVQLESSSDDLEIFKQRNSLSKFIGNYLWKIIFTDHPVLLKQLWESQGKIQTSGNIILQFEGEREYLDIPLELLNEDESYLGLLYPIVRLVSGISKVREAHFSKLLENLENEKKPLRLLFVAANTFSAQLGLPPIPGTDEEIKGIYDALQKRLHILDEIVNENEVQLKCQFQIRKEKSLIGPKIEIDVLYSHSASFKRIKEKLEDGYHIVHLAGHGCYHHQLSQQSCIYFWENDCSKEEWITLQNRALKSFREIINSRELEKLENKISAIINPIRGKLCKLSATDLANILTKSEETFLVYLSCCHTARTGSRCQLIYSKSLGFIDALVSGGIPIVIGHRWPLRDLESITFATEFYHHLLANYSPEFSLLQARQSVSQDNPTWASAVMVMQVT